MKKLLISLIVYVAGHLIYKHVVQTGSFKSVDKHMADIAEQMNQKLPVTHGPVRVDRVEYSARVMHYFGTLVGSQPMNAEFKAKVEQALRSMYCDNGAIVQAGVGVEYAFEKTGMKSISDKLSTDRWSVTVRPEHCR